MAGRHSGHELLERGHVQKFEPVFDVTRSSQRSLCALISESRAVVTQDDSDPFTKRLANCVAVDELVVLCLSRLRSLARRMLRRFPDIRRVEDTDDLLQNASIRMQRAFSAVTIDSPRAAMGLAVTQLKRELVDLIRRHRRETRRGLSADEDGADATSQQTDAVGRAASHDEDLSGWSAFHETVETLPREQKEAVHFLWYLGLDQATAAKMLGISDRTLRRHWREARATLRSRLRDLDLGS